MIIDKWAVFGSYLVFGLRSLQVELLKIIKGTFKIEIFSLIFVYSEAFFNVFRIFMYFGVNKHQQAKFVLKTIQKRVGPRDPSINQIEPISSCIVLFLLAWILLLLKISLSFVVINVGRDLPLLNTLANKNNLIYL